ncbi:hypothetical protein JHK82_033396 [Glycine max]|nr:hypothetical protein JHK85_034117 [Glycine max]KAG4985792.1 hypothetical protein JHK86_033483 [Glycine max]KAG5118976.1 hypothetical protein JHK82_033396 [Glycine max]KAG5139969.1 hypothetical protein JHK84_033737 [Glycine max]
MKRIKKKAMTEGLCLIYDHYLVVREWSPIHPSIEAIEKVVVWVHVFRLPIEYYDAKLLHAIRDRIGRTMRVDRTTLYQERGKCARLCVEVDLTQPLLALFELNNMYCKIEYEELHFLFLTCGRLGHYMEGCPDKDKPNTWNGEKPPQKDAIENIGDNEQVPNEGPWAGVKKLVDRGKERKKNKALLEMFILKPQERFVVLSHLKIILQKMRMRQLDPQITWLPWLRVFTKTIRRTKKVSKLSRMVVEGVTDIIIQPGQEHNNQRPHLENKGGDTRLMHETYENTTMGQNNMNHHVIEEDTGQDINIMEVGVTQKIDNTMHQLPKPPNPCGIG